VLQADEVTAREHELRHEECGEEAGDATFEHLRSLSPSQREGSGAHEVGGGEGDRRWERGAGSSWIRGLDARCVRLAMHPT
jgi:hypothetical protein